MQGDFIDRLVQEWQDEHPGTAHVKEQVIRCTGCHARIPQDGDARWSLRRHRMEVVVSKVAEMIATDIESIFVVAQTGQSPADAKAEAYRAAIGTARAYVVDREYR